MELRRVYIFWVNAFGAIGACAGLIWLWPEEESGVGLLLAAAIVGVFAYWAGAFVGVVVVTLVLYVNQQLEQRPAWKLLLRWFGTGLLFAGSGIYLFGSIWLWDVAKDAGVPSWICAVVWGLSQIVLIAVTVRIIGAVDRRKQQRGDGTSTPL